MKVKISSEAKCFISSETLSQRPIKFIDSILFFEERNLSSCGRKSVSNGSIPKPFSAIYCVLSRRGFASQTQVGTLIIGEHVWRMSLWGLFGLGVKCCTKNAMCDCRGLNDVEKSKC
ncbi:hypothetical protein NPIL_136401 [Nephila pilipes]|uniref:Uncharacterized protein n=1 Tax=Nephila pilipes TaxID=299642 RepID=A0A8X6UQC9_NEPPI|nr:hypothetical protein NPIL_136401 [Nephila pilipes]